MHSMDRDTLCATTVMEDKENTLIISLYSTLLASSAVAMEKVAFFYFNPDSVQSNFSLLTKEIDTFMTK